MNDIASAYDGAELIQKTYNVLEAAKEEVRLRASDECQRAKEWYKARFSGLEAERFMSSFYPKLIFRKEYSSRRSRTKGQQSTTLRLSLSFAVILMFRA